MYPPHELRAHRAWARRQMTGTCTVVRQGAFTPGAGGRGTFAAPVSEEIPCRLSSVASRGYERVVADRVAPTAVQTLVLPWDTDIEGVDTVSIDGVAHTVEGVAPLNTDAVELRVVIRSGG